MKKKEKESKERKTEKGTIGQKDGGSVIGEGIWGKGRKGGRKRVVWNDEHMLFGCSIGLVGAWASHC